MAQGRCLAVQDFTGLADIPTIDIQYTLPMPLVRMKWLYAFEMSDLLSHTDPEDGDFASKVTNCIPADARVRLRMSRTGTDNQLGGLLGNELVKGDLIVAEHRDGSSL